MKKWLILVSCLLTPVLSSATNANSEKALESLQELCAKEKDPLKRESYCHGLDQLNQAQINNDNRPAVLLIA